MKTKDERKREGNTEIKKNIELYIQYVSQCIYQGVSTTPCRKMSAAPSTAINGNSKRNIPK